MTKPALITGITGERIELAHQEASIEFFGDPDASPGIWLKRREAS